MSLQVLQKFIMGNRGLRSAIIKGGKIRFIFFQRQSDRLIDDVGHTSVLQFRFKQQGRFEIALELNSAWIDSFAHNGYSAPPKMEITQPDTSTYAE